MNIKVLQWISLVFLALVMGVFWGTWFTLTRSIERFSASCFLEIGHTIIANLAIPMRILMPATFLSMTAILLYHPNKGSFPYCLLITALLLLIGAVLVTLLVEVPIDYQIRDWTVSSLPDNWISKREIWSRYHSLRTALAIGSFSSYTAGILWNLKTGNKSR